MNVAFVGPSVTDTGCYISRLLFNSPVLVVLFMHHKRFVRMTSTFYCLLPEGLSGNWIRLKVISQLRLGIPKKTVMWETKWSAGVVLTSAWGLRWTSYIITDLITVNGCSAFILFLSVVTQRPCGYAAKHVTKGVVIKSLAYLSAVLNLWSPFKYLRSWSKTLCPHVVEAEWQLYLINIRDVLRLDVGLELCFCGFPHSFQANAGMSPFSRPQQLPSASFHFIFH
jgi:hypothetical protein